MKQLKIQTDLRKLGSKEKAKFASHFFKTAPGQYGFGDKFIGVTVPKTRLIAKKYQDLPFNQLSHLLKSPIHEDRLLALIILTKQYEKSKKIADQKKIINFYLKHKKRVNNWDLVDQSAYKILGHYCYHYNQKELLLKLANSSVHFERRIAMVATLAYIRNHNFELTYFFAKKFFKEKEDLMHKATGWMLREAGKKNQQHLIAFLDEHASFMPRTMLRYSIEKFSPEIRKSYLLKK